MAAQGRESRFKAPASRGDSNTVVGCFIGTSADGTTAKANGFGIDVYGSSSNTIGGTAAGALNVISGNTSQGISIGDALASNKNVVLGNNIGTDVTGKVALGNGQYGLLLDHTSDNTIGGTSAAAANVISGNKLDGILIEQSNGASIGNVVSFNKIGTNADGTAVCAERRTTAIHISLATSTTITGNLIAGNSQDGILVDPGTSSTTIQGNLIGVSRVADAPGINLGGSFNGLQFNDSANLGMSRRTPSRPWANLTSSKPSTR